MTRIISNDFFRRPAEIVAPNLIGCKLVKRQINGEIIWGVIIETEAYSQIEPGCHGYQRKTPSNETLFGEPGHLYVYLTYGIHHCVNVVTDRSSFASGVLLRSIAIADEDERVAAGPSLLARRFGLNVSHDGLPISIENGLWLIERSSTTNMHNILCTTRVGISKAKELSWRWYLQTSRSVSKRAKGDRCPSPLEAWKPLKGDGP